MRRSRDIPTCILLLAASGALAGCNNEHRDCVDDQNHKQPDSYCNAGTHPGAHFLYSGRSGGGYGDTVVGGHTESGISRGGFGHGGGGGEGE
ncbi:MAG TPA: hypothetical protein VH139_00070 [Acidobacteriaceae bacterium]|jgi:hypothetical protein|nr:hypothetical protein [Acidobacteriaceae bacterium]